VTKPIKIKEISEKNIVAYVNDAGHHGKSGSLGPMEDKC
jgi:hypothetical protein